MTEVLIRLGIVVGFFSLVITLPGLAGIATHLIIKGFLVGWSMP